MHIFTVLTIALAISLSGPAAAFSPGDSDIVQAEGGNGTEKERDTGDDEPECE
jgi:hypothetical protein